MSVTISSRSPERALPSGAFQAQPRTSALRLPTTVRTKGTLRESASIIGAIGVTVRGKDTRTTHVTRGERYATRIHHALARVSPQLADSFAERLERRLPSIRGRDLGTRFVKASEVAVRELVRERLLSREAAAEIRRAASSDAAPNHPLSGEDRASDRPTAPTPQHAGGTANGSIAPTPKGPTTPLQAPLGFLWKPISDSDGLLAVLLPVAWSDDATQVEILSPDGKTVLAHGRPAGIANGARAHFRFDQPGGAFPSGALVQVHRGDGTIERITIPSPSTRGEGVSQRLG